jgi:siderophore synthetase component
VLEEPAYLSLGLQGSDIKENRAVTEGFGLILREGLGHVAGDETPLLAGALFGNRFLGRARLRALVNRLAERERLSLSAAAESWFDAYVEHLLYPVFHCFFSCGLIFEPHLQNVLIGLRDGRPRRVWLRDFEGVKLVRERRVPYELEGVGERARQALFYSEEQGWNRIAYCLIVNNFCEAIAQLGEMESRLENRLWTVLRHHLREYQWRYGDFRSAERINALLAGQPLPAKANFINRFLKRPDRDAGYVPLPHPLAQAGEP